MSYLIESPCIDRRVRCLKWEKCADRCFIQGAVDGIHQASQENGHLGAGVIKHECFNAEYPKAED